jgi:hypothetical protein
MTPATKDRTREHLADITDTVAIVPLLWNLWKERGDEAAIYLARALAVIHHHVEAATLAGMGRELWCDTCRPRGLRADDPDRVHHMPCTEHDAGAIRAEAEAIARVLKEGGLGCDELEHSVTLVHQVTCDPEKRLNATWMAALAGSRLGIAAERAALLGQYGAIACATCIPGWKESPFPSWPCRDHGGLKRELVLINALIHAINQTGFEVPRPASPAAQEPCREPHHE